MYRKRVTLNWLIIGSTLLLISACVTSPNKPIASIDRDLFVCNGTNVSNAPAHDRSGKIKHYSPYLTINRIQLARAPVQGCLSSAYGKRRGGAGSFHDGIDLFTQKPVSIAAAGSGRIKSIGSQRGYGRTIIIDHGRGITTRYAHLSSYKKGLRIGLRIEVGDVIGRTGSSGNATAIHLHYEIRVHGRSYNPLLRKTLQGS